MPILLSSGFSIVSSGHTSIDGAKEDNITLTRFDYALLYYTKSILEYLLSD